MAQYFFCTIYSPRTAMSGTPEISVSTHASIPDSLPEEIKRELASFVTDVEWLSFDENGNVLLPFVCRVDSDNGHDYGRCIVSSAPKVSYDETAEVYDEDGNVIRLGEWCFEVQAGTPRRYLSHVEVQVDPDTGVRKDVPKYKQEGKVMVLASQVTPVPGTRMLPFPLKEIKKGLRALKASERMTQKGSASSSKKGAISVSMDEAILGQFLTGLPTEGKVFRTGSGLEISIPEGPNRTEAIMAYVEAFDKPEAPDSEALEAFKATYDLE